MRASTIAVVAAVVVGGCGPAPTTPGRTPVVVVEPTPATSWSSPTPEAEPPSIVLECPPETPRPPPGGAILLIDASTPTTVCVNGRREGTTPLEVDNLGAGDYVVTFLTREGLSSYSVYLDAGAALRVFEATP